jgi:hypothetical protein
VIVADTNAQVGFADGCREALTFDAAFGRGQRVRRLP